MGLLHLVEEHDRVGPAAHRLGQLTTLLVAHVTRRGTDEPRHRVPLGVLRHVQAHHGALVVEEEVRQRLRELGLAHPRGPEEEERARGSVGVGHPCAGAAHGIGDSAHRGPGRDHLGDVVGADPFLDHQVSRVDLGLGRLSGLDLALERGDLAIEHAGCRLVVPLALHPLGLGAQVVEPGLEVTDLVQPGLLRLPPRGEARELLGPVGEVGPQPLEPLDGGLVGLLHQVQLLHAEPVDASTEHVDLDRAGVDLHAQPGGRFVDEVDRLVGELAPADVAVGQARGCDQRGVLDLDLVVRLVALLQTAQDGDRVLHRGLADEDLLEAALQRGILLDVLAELV